jgi:FKBP-type peptidyl-prolyl cis-trans isomerase FkpA
MKHFIIALAAISCLPLMAQKPGVKATPKKAAQKPKVTVTMVKPVAKTSEWISTPSGLKMKIYPKAGNSAKPAVGDLISFQLMVKNEKDSVLMNSYDKAGPNHGEPMQIELTAPVTASDLMEAFQKLGKGDSAVVKVPTDSIFKGPAAAQRPPFLPAGSSIVYNVKMYDITSHVARDEQEKSAIEKFIKDSSLKATKTSSGMYYVIMKQGTGEVPKAGDDVIVHYSGRLLNGKEFDQSYKRGQPFTFKLGQGQVIKGWDEGIGMLKTGSKAKLIIPSALGYGSRGAGADIPPYAPLVFDVELIGVKK